MFYITTPIPYVNGEPHLGHLLEALFNDTIARYRRRSLAEPVIYSMGLDQHGLKIYQNALKNNLTPQQYVDKESQRFIKLWQEFEISNDILTETTSKKHAAISQIVWKKLLKKNLIYKKSYTGKYCVGCEAFYTDSQLDENGNCLIHKTKTIEMTEENYFFKLSKFQDSIVEYLKNGDIRPLQYKKEWLNFCNQGLEDISISREKQNLSWGIAVPDDDNQVMYVWFEALVNYLTGLVDEESADKWLEFPLQQKEFETEIWDQIQKNWPNSLHYMGKDMCKFHLVIWPALLHGLDLELPKLNLVHGFINDSQGLKFSKSMGNGILPRELVAKFGIDGTRFIMLAEMNDLDDTNFDWNQVTNQYNSLLANNLGNLVMRVSNLVETMLNGIIDENYEDLAEKIAQNNPTLVKLEIDLKLVYQNLEQFQTQDAIKLIFNECSKINEYLEQTKPWSLIKDSKNLDYVNYILSNSSESLKEIGKALSIFLPETGDKIYKIFSAPRISKAPLLFTKVEVEKSNLQ